MNRSTPGLPVHHQLPEFTQTHVHRVSDVIQPTYRLSSPSPPAPNPSQHQSQLFSNESTLRMRWLKYWSFSFSIIPSKNHPGLISFRIKHNTQLLGCAFFFFSSRHSKPPWEAPNNPRCFWLILTQKTIPALHPHALASVYSFRGRRQVDFKPDTYN